MTQPVPTPNDIPQLPDDAEIILREMTNSERLQPWERAAIRELLRRQSSLVSLIIRECNGIDALAKERDELRLKLEIMMTALAHKPEHSP